MSASIPNSQQLVEDVGTLAVAQVVAVFLEREAEHADSRALHGQALVDDAS